MKDESFRMSMPPSWILRIHGRYRLSTTPLYIRAQVASVMGLCVCGGGGGGGGPSHVSRVLETIINGSRQLIFKFLGSQKLS